MTYIAPIVEGHGELEAVPRLLQRIVADAAPGTLLRVNKPIRVKSGSFLKDEGYFKRHVALAAAKARQQTRGHVLILFDCEDDCPAELGPALLGRAQREASDTSFVVALAHREYETWFIAAAQSLQGIGGLPVNLAGVADPEAMRDAKGWLGRHMPHRYDPVAHQLAFTNAFDLTAARAVMSFDRLYRKIAALAKPRLANLAEEARAQPAVTSVVSPSDRIDGVHGPP